MARDSHSATWRACLRVVSVLLANVGTELTADKPSGLNVAAPAAGDYYVLPNEAAVRAHNERNHFVQVYVFPSSERTHIERTTGPTSVSVPSEIEITIAVRVVEELGAADFEVSGWKTLGPKEREFLRCETLLGAIQDAIRTKVRGPAVSGDDIVHAQFVSSTSGDDRFRRVSDEPGTWCSQRWRIKQIINTPIQTS